MIRRLVLFFTFLTLAHCDICSICECTFVNVTSVEPEPLENVEIIAFKFKMNSIEPFTANATYQLIQKYFYVDCSSDNNVGQINNLKWPQLNVLGTFGNFKRSKWKKLEFFPDHIKKQMKVLSLSDNLITEIEPAELDDFSKLKMLNLSGNQIKSVNKSTFGKLNSLMILDLSKNSISDVDEWAFYGTSLKYLNLSGNSLADLKPNVFRGLNELILLDLSRNKLINLPENLKNFLPLLTTFSLYGNSLTKVPEMPKNLKKLDLKNNNFTDLKLLHSELEVLDVSENQLQSLSGISAPLLKVIRASHNNLTKSLNLNSHGLIVIDLSYNNFDNIPDDVTSSHFYFLEKLYLEGNPVTQVNFNGQTESFQNLKLISLVNCSLKYVQKDSFHRLFKKSTLTCQEGEGISLNLSHNAIELIEENAFTNITLCSVDLSYNNLKTLTKNTITWNSMSRINLQGNPWNCDCKIQWILDDLMVHLYKNYPSLLHELRCATPLRYKNKMFVSWYNKTENVFCKARSSVYYVNVVGGKTLEIWTGSAIACVVLGCFIILMIITILILLCVKPSKKKKKQIKCIRNGKSADYKPILQNVKKEGNRWNDQRV